ncbi:PerC family transcriptional regulator [Erwinia sp. D4-22]
MMNDKALILTYLLAYPGITSAQLTRATGIRRPEVNGILSALTLIGDAYRDAKGRYFVSEQASEGDQKFSELSDKACRLEEKGWWNRAAEVWLCAMDSTRKETLRQKAIQRRKHCISTGAVRCGSYGGISSAIVRDASLEDVFR